MAEARDTRALMADALLRLKEARERIETLEAEKHGELAIVGLGLRFPGLPGEADAEDADSFWRLLAEGRDLVRPIPADRWDVERFHDDDYDAPGRIVAREGAFLADPALFDPQHFGIAPREAETMDPQQRLLLETCWRALEHAGISTDAVRGSRTGVFVGIATSDYSAELVRRLSYRDFVAQTGTGTNHSVAAGRIAYTFGLTGPCLAVNTACSSSLVALQLACESLRRRECDAALVAGVNLILSPMTSMVFSNARMLSRDGRCRTFDARAAGYGRAEGCGVLVLKRLADAVRERDRILACVLGCATNQDGASGGITVPHGPSQQAVIRAALANARVAPDAVSYVEAHGTGTALGDPIELGALGAVFGPERATPLAVASVKTNLGHAEAAAGVAGVIKTVLQMRRGRIAPHLHLAEPTPHVAWERLPLRVPRGLEDWPSAGRRIAGVSSFGFSGTNAHVVLGQAPRVEQPAADAAQDAWMLPLSARTPAALRDLARAWRSRLARAAHDGADACFTAGRGRAHFAHRLAVVGANADELARRLASWLAEEPDAGTFAGEVHERIAAKAVDLPATAAELARAYVAGLRIPWDELDPERARRRVTIPGYPFRRERHWCLPADAPEDGAPSLAQRESFVFTRWTWMPKVAPAEGAAAGRWSVVGEGALRDILVAGLAERGIECDRTRAPAECDAVVFAWEAEDTPSAGERGALALLALVRTLVAGSGVAGAARPPRLALVTRDGVADAALQGLARVAAIEHPELALRRIVADGGWGPAAVAELLANDLEDEVRLSHDGRTVARLVETAPVPARRLALGGAWLVTGGLGALGRRIAARLIARGATRVVLVGRRAEAVPDELAAFGEAVEVRACDVSDGAACAALARALPPLEGVVHAAGVLDDGVLDDLTPERLVRVLRPKLAGAWNLHEAFATSDGLRAFVMISSSAALLGSPGQANYVAANWTLDALARARRRAGLPALTLHLGPIAGEGMAADEATARRLGALGMRTLSSARGLDALETLLARDFDAPGAGDDAAFGFFTLDWRTFARAVPPGVEPRRLDAFLAALPTQAAEGEPELLSELLDAEMEERAGLLADYVARALGRVLRMPADAVDRHRAFPELGLDSLLGIELRNRIQGDLSVSAPMASILGSPSTDAFAGDLLALLVEAGLIVDPGGDRDLSPELLSEIEGLSDEEVERLLDQDDAP
jgi:3-oxoacyl-(acyl-carrier-protein) synthase/NAD(P)-dependent dehydrogenase (short-subunit alcohol dehydrogenase family)